MVKRTVMKLCIKFIDVNIETYVNEITDKPVDNTTDRNNNHRANLNIDNNRNIKIAFSKHKKSVRNCDCEMYEIANHCWKADHNFS